MNRIYIEDINKYKGQEISIFGWVNVRRDQGKMIFIDLRDVTGKVQAVILPNNEEALNTANEVRNEWLIKLTGIINERPEKNKKDEINGDVEMEVKIIEVISKSKNLPFEISNNTIDIDEELRLKYRYLDLRSKRMQDNIIIRSKWINACREYLINNKFIEIETPLLTQSSPEGSRDFVVPSRLYKGKFYALPQSPQQYKQLLMVAGFDRYFQLARAIRDEDLRADRGFEHTQIDIEASFVEQEDILNIIENMIIHSAEKVGKKIKEIPFPRITYKEAMERYGADKFDLRTDEDRENGILAYAWVIDFPFFEKTEEGGWTFTHNPFSMPKKEDLEKLLKGEDIENIMTQQYDLVCNGYESGGGSIRSNDPNILKAVYKIMGNTDGEIEDKIGHMLEAFEYGAPTHGGIAIGVERNVMNLTGETALREVQSFPMTRGGQTSVMKGPSSISNKQLDELGIEIKKNE